MVNVSIDVTDLGGEARPGDKVVFWRPRMGGSATHAGRVISTAPVTVFLTDGKASVPDVEPGEMTVLLQCRGVESQGPVTVGVPDGDHTVTLRALLESQFEYAPPIVSAVQEAASNASASEEAAIQAQIRSEAAADRADAKVDDAINNGANLVRNEVKQDADRAVSARQAATQSESNAAASENAAASSASNAATSETNAKQSEDNAGDYAAVATTAATEAVDAMDSVTDIIGAKYATREYVDDGLGGKADISYVDDAKWSRPRFGGNLNDLTTPGAYPITSSAINRPSSTEGTLEVTPVGGGTGVYQQFKEGGSEGITYVRTIRSAGSLPSDWTLLADQAYRLRQIRTADLDDMVESGIYAQHLTGNTSEERHYPVRRRGLLIVSAMGSGIISQTYLTPVGGFCRERQGDGTWLEWGSLAGSLDTDLISRIAEDSAEDAVRVAVEQIIEKSSPEKSLVTYGRSQPDPWIYPDTDLYWNGPNGTQFYPAGYEGAGFVGAIGNDAGYSSLIVEKADSDNLYISAINPVTNRHVTYRIEGKAGDDMAIISGIWVGDMTSEGRASRDTVLTQRSNMEWAFRLSIDGVEQFIPWHGDNTAIAVEPTVFTDSSGNIIDIEAQPHRVPITNLDGFKVKQKLWGRHPETGDKNHLLIEQVTSFSPDGLVRSETSVEFLETVSPIRQSAGNLPINAGVSDTFHVFGGGSYPVPAGTGSYQDIQITDDNFTSGMFTGSGGVFAAVNLIEPDYTLARSVPGLTGGGEKYIQVRPDGFVKFYQRSIAADQAVSRGTKWRFGAEWRYGEVDNPVQYV